LKHRIQYVFDDGRLALHLESAYDAFRAHCKRIDYEGEVVDLKAMRRMLTENRLQDGYVVEEGRKVCFAGKASRRRSVIIDVEKTTSLTLDDFPTGADDEGNLRDGFKSRYGWNDAS
jgi:hypothetical protein